MTRKPFLLLLLMFAGACSPAIQAAPVLVVNTSTPGQTEAPQKPVALAQTSTPAPTPIRSRGELQFPIRAAFYYPWFPEAWNQQGMNPFTHYSPDLGYYNQDQLSVIQRHIVEMQYGKIQAGIASWWGQGKPTDQRVASLLKLGEQMNFYWALYMESEGVGNPTVAAIRSDLVYIRDHYSQTSAYLKISGKFVIFVYAEPADGCEMVTRWTQANTVGAYLVLKVFPGYLNCSAQPDGWHQYAPSSSALQEHKYSYTISPGFWKANEAQPRLARDIATWAKDIQTMIASKANFQLITTFNEWGEGTAVEGAKEWTSSSPFGIYLDALHYDGNLPASLYQPGSANQSSAELLPGLGIYFFKDKRVEGDLRWENMQKLSVLMSSTRSVIN